MSERGEAAYIGDGVYAVRCPIDKNAFELCTFDGLRKGNVIYFDAGTFQSVLAWVEKQWGVKIEVKRDAAG